MPPRRSHEKTKTGCKTCRKRRVKCSEEFPACNNCLKREIECIWAESTNAALRTASPMYNTPDPLTAVSAVSTFSMDLPTLELMHHYTNVACYSLHGYHPDLVEVWKTTIPSLAFSTHAHFLLHAMFAMSALHLSEIQSEPTLSLRYRYTAATHFDHAKRASHIGMNTTDGLGVSFISHLLLALYSFFTSKSLHDPEWIRLIRSRFPSTVVNVWNKYAVGPIGPLVRNISHSYRHTTALDLQHGPLPPYLSTIHLPSAGTPDPEEVMDPRVSETYAEAVRMTKRMLAASSEVGNEMQYLAWVVLISDDYLRLLWERRPRALVIAAHYCAIMTRVAHLHPMTWWIQMRQRWQDEADNIRKEVGDAWKDWMPSEDWFVGMDSRCFSEPSVFIST